MEFSASYFIDLFKNYFKERKITFYIAFSMAVLSIITSIVYLVTLGHLEKYISYGVFSLFLIGGLAFLILSYFRLSNLGAGLLSLISFAGFLVYLATIYGYPIEQIMVIPNIFDIKEIPAIIFCAGLMIICAITSNVCAWMGLNKAKQAERLNIN